MEANQNNGNDQPKMVNISQVPLWLSTLFAKNASGALVKPSDLKMLYMLVLWEYLSKNGASQNEPDNKEQGDKDEPKIVSENSINSDKDIEIPEQDLIKIVNIFFNKTYYPYFNRVFYM